MAAFRITTDSAKRPRIEPKKLFSAGLVSGVLLKSKAVGHPTNFSVPPAAGGSPHLKEVWGAPHPVFSKSQKDCANTTLGGQTSVRPEAANMVAVDDDSDCNSVFPSDDKTLDEKDNQDIDEEQVGCSRKKRRVATWKPGAADGGASSRREVLSRHGGVLSSGAHGNRKEQEEPTMEQMITVGEKKVLAAEREEAMAELATKKAELAHTKAHEHASDDEEDKALIKVIATVKRIAHNTRLEYARAYEHLQATRITRNKARLTSLNAVSNMEVLLDLLTAKRKQEGTEKEARLTASRHTTAVEITMFQSQQYTSPFSLLEQTCTSDARPPQPQPTCHRQRVPQADPEGRSLCPPQEGQPFPIGQDSAMEGARQAGGAPAWLMDANGDIMREGLGPHYKMVIAVWTQMEQASGGVLLVCLASAPAWLMDANGNIMREGLGPHYKMVIAVWTQMEQASGGVAGVVGLVETVH
ncbi:hypothetical protein B0H14DRAFT_2579058 [Mycena olivaceomarginata]|nr:hypothetical protein B0H14DRAFT_2579058 [Mycena olivaceomarginata]